MPLAIFNISNSTLNLAISLAIFVLVVIWLAMVVYTFLDARRRIEDPFLIGCATVASLFPLVGTAVYAILRPPEFLADAHERDLEVEAAELRVRHLKAQSCPGCGYPTERNFMRCPSCERRLKDPCTSCDRPVDPRWSICPYCETALPGRRRETRRPAGRSKAAAGSSGRGGSETKSRTRAEEGVKATAESRKAVKSRTRPAADGEGASSGSKKSGPSASGKGGAGRPSRAGRDR